MLVLRKCVMCGNKFSYDYTCKQKQFCWKCNYKRRQESNKRHKQLHPEKYKTYQKDYYQRTRGKRVLRERNTNGL